MPFRPYEEIVEPLAFTYHGTTYTLPDVGIDDGLRLNLAIDAASIDGEQTDVEAVPPEDWERILLGTAGQQMRADSVPPAFFNRVFAAAVAEFRTGREAAEEMWERYTDPKATTVPRPASEPSTSTDEGTTTPSPASGSTTKTSRPKRQPSAAAKAD